MEQLVALVQAIAAWIQKLIDTCKEFAAGWGKTFKYEEQMPGITEPEAVD